MTEKFVTLPREVVEQVLKAAEAFHSHYKRNIFSGCVPSEELYFSAAMASLRAALEQPHVEQEPVAWALSHSRGLEFSSTYPMQKSKQAAEQMARQHMGAVTVSPLYTHPQPNLKPLTLEQILQVKGQFTGTLDVQFDKFARAIEHIHNIK